MPRATIAFAILLLSYLVSSTAFAERAGGIEWTAPEGWQAQGQRPMRAATYVVPAVAGDGEDGECAVFYFGPGQGGTVDANVERWRGQFEPAPGSTSLDETSESTKVNGLTVTTIELGGTFLWKPRPMAQEVTRKPGYRMLAAIVDAPEGPVFFKLTAPAATAAAAADAFRHMLSSVKTAD